MYVVLPITRVLHSGSNNYLHNTWLTVPCCCCCPDPSCFPPAGGRTSEGFFQIKGGIESAIARGLAYAPYADLVWFEVSKLALAGNRAVLSHQTGMLACVRCGLCSMQAHQTFFIALLVQLMVLAAACSWLSTALVWLLSMKCAPAPLAACVSIWLTLNAFGLVWHGTACSVGCPGSCMQLAFNSSGLAAVTKCAPAPLAPC
jgi:hypothetical protein